MDDIKIFENSEFGTIRTALLNNEPVFCLSDICKILGLSNATEVKKRLSEKGLSYIETLTNGGRQNLIYINESNLYKTIFQSRKPSAERFTDWVTSEVLPSIRKNGGYIANQEQLTPEQIVANALIVAQNIIKEKDRKIAELQPKGDYFDSLVDSKLLTNFRDCAKEFHISPQKFTQWLVDKGYIYRDSHNILKPYEQHRKSGLFQMKDFENNGYSGIQTFITVRGKETFRLLLGV